MLSMRLWLIIVLLTSSYSFQLRSQEQPSPSATSTRPCISPHIVWIFSVIILCHVAGLVNRSTERNSGPDRRLSTTALDNPWRSIMETISSGMSSGILNTLYSNRIISTAKTFRCANGFNNNACNNGFNKPVANPHDSPNLEHINISTRLQYGYGRLAEKILKTETILRLFQRNFHARERRKMRTVKQIGRHNWIFWVSPPPPNASVSLDRKSETLQTGDYCFSSILRSIKSVRNESSIFSRTFDPCNVALSRVAPNFGVPITV